MSFGEREQEQVTYVPMIRDMPASERPRERLERVGAQALSTAELLAIILRTGTGGESVLRLSERLIAQTSGLKGIAQSSLTELQHVKGIGPAKAVEIKAALEIGRRLFIALPEERPKISAPEDAANLLMSEMMFLKQEYLRVLLLDTRNNVLKIHTVYQGNLNTSVIRIAEVFREPIRENAAAIILAHNHPSGDPTPSPEDVRVTRKIGDAGNLLGIELLDHVVIGHNRFVSLKEQGLGFD